MKKPNTYIVNIIFFTIFFFFFTSYQMEQMKQKGLSHTNFVQMLNTSKETFMKKPNQLLEGFSLIIEYIEKYKISDGKEFLQKIQKAPLEKQWRIFEEMRGIILSNKIYSIDFHGDFISRMQHYTETIGNLLQEFREKKTQDAIAEEYFRNKGILKQKFRKKYKKRESSEAGTVLHGLYPLFLQKIAQQSKDQQIGDQQNGKEKKLCGDLLRLYNNVLCAQIYCAFCKELELREKIIFSKLADFFPEEKFSKLGGPEEKLSELNEPVNQFTFIKKELLPEKTNNFCEEFTDKIQPYFQNHFTISPNIGIIDYFCLIGDACKKEFSTLERMNYAIVDFLREKLENIQCIRFNMYSNYPMEKIGFSVSKITNKVKDQLEENFYMISRFLTKNLKFINNQDNTHPFYEIHRHTMALRSINYFYKQLVEKDSLKTKYPLFYENKNNLLSLSLDLIKKEYKNTRSLHLAKLREIYAQKNKIATEIQSLQEKINTASALEKKINAIKRNIADKERLKSLENDLTSLQGNAPEEQIQLITNKINAIKERLEIYTAEYGKKSLVSSQEVFLALSEKELSDYFIKLNSQSNQEQNENYENSFKKLQELKKQQNTLLNELEKQIQTAEKLFRDRSMDCLRPQQEQLFNFWLLSNFFNNSYQELLKMELGIKVMEEERQEISGIYNRTGLYGCLMNNYSMRKKALLNDTSEESILTKTQLILDFLTTTEQLCAETITEFKKTHKFTQCVLKTCPLQEHKKMLALLQSDSQKIADIKNLLNNSEKSAITKNLIHKIYAELPISCPNKPDFYTISENFQSLHSRCKNIVNLQQLESQLEPQLEPQSKCSHFSVFFPLDKLIKSIRCRTDQIEEKDKMQREQERKDFATGCSGFHRSCKIFQKLETLCEENKNYFVSTEKETISSDKVMPPEIDACSNIIQKYVEEN